MIGVNFMQFLVGLVGFAILWLLFLLLLKDKIPSHRWVKSRVVKITDHYEKYDSVHYELYERSIYWPWYVKAKFCDYERKDGEKGIYGKQMTRNHFSEYEDCLKHINIRRKYKEYWFNENNRKPDTEIVYDEEENKKRKSCE